MVANIDVMPGSSSWLRLARLAKLLSNTFRPVLILEAPGTRYIDRRYPQNPGRPGGRGGPVGLLRGAGEQAPYTSNEVLPDSAGALGGAAISGYAEISHSDPAAR